MWYISYILLCYLITPLLYDLIQYLQQKNKNLFVYMIICIISIIFICRSFCWYFTPAWIGCYVIGFFLAFIKDKINNKRVLSIFLNLIVIVSYIIKYKLRYDILPNIDPTSYLYVIISYFIDYSRVLCGLTIFVDVYSISCVVKRLLPNLIIIYLKRILDFFDKNSYDIFLIHMIFVKGVLSTINLSPIIIINILFCILLSTISGVAIKHFSEKVGNYLNSIKCKR